MELLNGQALPDVPSGIISATTQLIFSSHLPLYLAPSDRAAIALQLMSRYRDQTGIVVIERDRSFSAPFC